MAAHSTDIPKAWNSLRNSDDTSLMFTLPVCWPKEYCKIKEIHFTLLNSGEVPLEVDLTDIFHRYSCTSSDLVTVHTVYAHDIPVEDRPKGKVTIQPNGSHSLIVQIPTTFTLHPLHAFVYVFSSYTGSPALLFCPGGTQVRIEYCPTPIDQLQHNSHPHPTKDHFTNTSYGC